MNKDDKNNQDIASLLELPLDKEIIEEIIEERLANLQERLSYSNLSGKINFILEDKYFSVETLAQEIYTRGLYKGISQEPSGVYVLQLYEGDDYFDTENFFIYLNMKTPSFDTQGVMDQFLSFDKAVKKAKSMSEMFAIPCHVHSLEDSKRIKQEIIEKYQLTGYLKYL